VSHKTRRTVKLLSTYIEMRNSGFALSDVYGMTGDPFDEEDIEHPVI